MFPELSFKAWVRQLQRETKPLFLVFLSVSGSCQQIWQNLFLKLLRGCFLLFPGEFSLPGLVDVVCHTTWDRWPHQLLTAQGEMAQRKVLKMLDNLHQDLMSFTSSLPPALQWLGVMLAGCIPFIESYGASSIGIVAGVPVVLSVFAAIVGNIATMLIAVIGAGAGRLKIAELRSPQSFQRSSAENRLGSSRLARRGSRLMAMVHRFGVPVVCMVGQTLLPSQITSVMMVAAGASKKQVILWQCASIVVWAVVFAGIATGVIQAFGWR